MLPCDHSGVHGVVGEPMSYERLGWGRCPVTCPLNREGWALVPARLAQCKVGLGPLKSESIVRVT